VVRGLVTALERLASIGTGAGGNACSVVAGGLVLVTERAAIALSSVSVCAGERVILENMNLRIPIGSLMAVIGPNGTGKTTLLEALVGLRELACGEVQYGVDQRRMALLRQRHGLNLEMPCTVREFVALGAWSSMGALRKLGTSAQQQVDAALHRLGLVSLAQRTLSQISPGELQRARFAQLLVRDAEVILLDEPFSALDEDVVQLLLSVIRAWHGQGRTVIAVLHDLSQVREAFPVTLRLRRGVEAYGETAQVLGSLPRPAVVGVGA
jgi:zinc/manganese transport system ATP-binding protein